MVTRLDRASSLRGTHDAFLVDVWGVMHAGGELYPGVVDTVRALADGGGKVLFLSNSSRLGPAMEENLVAMGVPRDVFEGVVSSGDVTREALAARDATVFAGLPARPRVLHVGAAGYVPWLFELDLDFVGEERDADLVVVTGTVSSDAELAVARERLRPLAARGVPLVCTNPDRLIPSTTGAVALGPGALAAAYAELGGSTFLYGKPHAPIYEAALARLGAPKERVVAVGDMIATDVAGARAAGIRAVLVTTGVHAEDLGAAPDDETLERLCARHGARPDAILARFGA